MLTGKRESLGHRAISAAKWNYLGTGAKVLLQFAVGVWLARLLGPEAFGVVAVALLMLGVGRLVSDFGFSAALIQRSDLTERDIGYVFTVQVALGLSLSLAGFYLSSEIATFFNHPPAKSVIAVMSWIFLIQALGQTSTAMLNRALRYRFTQTVAVGTYFLGFIGFGLPLAYLGYGVWSLVAAQMVQAIAYTLVVLVKSGVAFRPALRPSRPGLFAFGGKVVGANLSSWGISNIDNVVIGRFLGVVDLGVYGRAMSLVGTPMNAMTTSLQGVLFSTCSRLQHDREKVVIAYLAVTELLAYACIPLFVTVAVIPKAVTLGVYGENWSVLIPVLTPLALAMPVNAMLAVVGPVLMALDKTHAELRAQLAAFFVMVPMIAVAAQYSLAVVAWAVLAAYLFRWLLLWLAIQQQLGLRWAQLASVLARPAALGIAVAAVTRLFASVIPEASAPVRLGFLVVVAAIALALLVRLFGPALFRGPLGASVKGGEKLPRPVAWWLRVGRDAR